MRIALCQINPTVGDLAGNAGKVLAFARRAADAGADLAVFPELCLTGYPPMDLLDRPAFLDDVEAAADHLAAQLPPSLGVIAGAPARNPGGVGKRLYNAALLLENGRVVTSVSKTLLPTYDVFDEYRYFEPCLERKLVSFRGVKLGLHVCEDLWNNEDTPPYHLYAHNPIDELAALGAELFVNISASPFALGKQAERTRIVAASCREHGLPFVYVNQVGANTELIFDGDSRVHAADGSIVLRAPSFEEALCVWDLNESPAEEPHGDADDDEAAAIHDALVLGIRDYVEKTGLGVFKKALLGLSGGIDSAVTAALAVAALGADRVVGVTMPSKYSSGGSVTDSEALAQALGIEFHNVSIRPAVDAFSEMLAPLFAGLPEDVTEENLQARARGVTLMAISNKFGHLLLTTGNKSEMAVGYATLYGDMNGGLAVLADVFKTKVYRVAEHINRRAAHEIIPRSTITKPPSAELRPGQTDQDSLPPYDVLDAILAGYVEEHRSAEDIAQRTGHDRALVEKVIRMVDRAEFKRQQAAPALRVSRKAFGTGRRLPIVMRTTRVEPVTGQTEVVEEAPAASAPES
ncbi:MAG TPA: NAD+ synthase [Rubricoccaceae bacterium]|nr:NAD+ synthase [Rubricoccaceae bacterium]